VTVSFSNLPDIDFARIRPYGQPASRANAFEELASILIEQGAVDWPAGVRFDRFGNPDGGREGRGVLPSGDVWAWQVKYVFDFDSVAGQLASSIKRALDLEPKLKRYIVALPFDLPAGDTPGSARPMVSAFTSGRARGWSGRRRPGMLAAMSSSSSSMRTSYSPRLPSRGMPAASGTGSARTCSRVSGKQIESRKRSPRSAAAIRRVCTSRLRRSRRLTP
jgi:hypothetical protein